MSSKQHRNLQATPANADALESLQHMTSWARQSITSPEAAPMQAQPDRKSSFASVIEGFALGATAFHPGPWIYPIDQGGEADLEREARPSGPSFVTRAARATGGAIVRAWRSYQEHREIAKATSILSQMDERSLRDIGISRGDIGRAARYGREWGRWR